MVTNFLLLERERIDSAARTTHACQSHFSLAAAIRNLFSRTVATGAVDGDVDAASTVILGMKFYDEDSHKDWTNLEAQVSDLSAKVSAGLAWLGPTGVAGGAALLILTQAVGLGMALDQDDLLGDNALELPVSRYPIGTTTLTAALGVMIGPGIPAGDT